MADPKVILCTSVEALVLGFFTNKGDAIKVGIGHINYGVIPPPPPLLIYVKNSYLFDKFVIELVAL